MTTVATWYICEQQILGLTSDNVLLTGCRVLSLSDCKYSLNPLNQTRIDKPNTVYVQTEL